jgi:hypothetical protein
VDVVRGMTSSRRLPLVTNYAYVAVHDDGMYLCVCVRVCVCMCVYLMFVD